MIDKGKLKRCLIFAIAVWPVALVWAVICGLWLGEGLYFYGGYVFAAVALVICLPWVMTGEWWWRLYRNGELRFGPDRQPSPRPVDPTPERPTPRADEREQ